MTRYIPPKLKVNPVISRLRELGAKRVEIAEVAGTSLKNVDFWFRGFYQPNPEHQRKLNKLLLKFETKQDVVQELKALQSRIDSLVSLRR